MKYSECLETLVKLAPDKFVSIQVETSGSPGMRVTIWRLYAEGGPWTDGCSTPEQALDAMKVLLSTVVVPATRTTDITEIDADKVKP